MTATTRQDAEEGLTEKVAQLLYEKLDLKPTAFVESLVKNIAKQVVGDVQTIKQINSPIPQKQIKQNDGFNQGKQIRTDAISYAPIFGEINLNVQKLITQIQHLNKNTFSQTIQQNTEAHPALKLTSSEISTTDKQLFSTENVEGMLSKLTSNQQGFMQKTFEAIKQLIATTSKPVVQNTSIIEQTNIQPVSLESIKTEAQKHLSSAIDVGTINIQDTLLKIYNLLLKKLELLQTNGAGGSGGSGGPGVVETVIGYELLKKAVPWMQRMAGGALATAGGLAATASAIGGTSVTAAPLLATGLTVAAGDQIGKLASDPLARYIYGNEAVDQSKEQYGNIGPINSPILGLGQVGLEGIGLGLESIESALRNNRLESEARERENSKQQAIKQLGFSSIDEYVEARKAEKAPAIKWDPQQRQYLPLKDSKQKVTEQQTDNQYKPIENVQPPQKGVEEKSKKTVPLQDNKQSPTAAPIPQAIPPVIPTSAKTEITKQPDKNAKSVVEEQASLDQVRNLVLTEIKKQSNQLTEKQIATIFADWSAKMNVGSDLKNNKEDIDKFINAVNSTKGQTEFKKLIEMHKTQANKDSLKTNNETANKPNPQTQIKPIDHNKEQKPETTSTAKSNSTPKETAPENNKKESSFKQTQQPVEAQSPKLNTQPETSSANIKIKPEQQTVVVKVPPERDATIKQAATATEQINVKMDGLIKGFNNIAESIVMLSKSMGKDVRVSNMTIPQPNVNSSYTSSSADFSSSSTTRYAKTIGGSAIPANRMETEQFRVIPA